MISTVGSECHATSLGFGTFRTKNLTRVISSVGSEHHATSVRVGAFGTKNLTRVISSVGSEHLVYTQGVGSSSLSSPTDRKRSSRHRWSLFLFWSMFITYILYSSDLDRYYTGYSSMTAEARLSYHLTNHKGYTGRAKDWVIVYVEEHDVKETALESERKIKKRGAKRFLQDNGDQSITL